MPVALPCTDESEVGGDRLLQHIVPGGAVDGEVPGLLRRGGDRDRAVGVVAPRESALGDLGAGAGDRVEAGDAGAAGAQPLGEGALRGQLDLELALQVLPRELLVLADVGGHHPADLFVAKQDAEPPVVHPQLLEMTSRSVTPASWMAAINTLGTPQRPNPPTERVAPSTIPSIASDAEETTLSMRGL